MQIQTISNNKAEYKTSFGAKIKLKGDNIKTFINYFDKQHAGEILDKFEQLHPDDVVEISTLKSDWNPYDVLLHARNLTTGATTIIPGFSEGIEKSQRPHHNRLFYQFLEYLMNPNEFHGFNNFWSREKVNHYANTEIEKHSVFIV